MFGRFNKGTRHLKHWSTVAFTVPPSEDERDVEFPDGTTLPGSARSVRATADWQSLEIDPEPQHPPPPSPPNTILGYVIRPPTWLGGPPEFDSPPARDEEVFRYRFSAGVTLSARRYSLLLFDFTGWPGVPLIPPDDSFFSIIEAFQGEWLDVMNAHAACLVHAISEIPSTDVRKREIKPGDFIFAPGDSRSGPGLVTLWGMAALPPPSQTIDERSLSHAAVLLDQVLRQVDLTLPIVALLNRAACYCEERNFPLALVAGWTIAERLVNVLGQRVGIAKRQVGELISALAAQGHLPNAIVTDLTSSRKARNEWLHAGGSVDWKTAAEAVETARKMIAHVLGITLRLPLIRIIYS